jgi:hypothetical protein
MLNKALIDIFNLFPNHTVYVHNLGGFDSLYFIKPLFQIGKVKTLFKDNKLISISLKNKKKKINFKDSLALLPLSLDSLIKSLSIDTPKLHFPYLFVNKNKLNYCGPIPERKFFSGLSLNDYNELASKYVSNN